MTNAPKPQTLMLAVKTPMMKQPTTTTVDADLTVSESLTHLRSSPPKGENATRVLQQIERETSGTFDYIAVRENGEIVTVTPQTPLREIAVPREIRTKAGLEELLQASYEVQAYAPVGSQG